MLKTLVDLVKAENAMVSEAIGKSIERILARYDSVINARVA